MVSCLIDNTKHESQKDLVLHLKKEFKMKLSDYAIKYEARFDLFDKSHIPYKTYDQYLNSYFSSRGNLVSYLRANPNDKDIIRKTIAYRVLFKDLKFAPSTVESRTCMLPTPLLVNKCGHNYNLICKSLDLIARYDYDQSLSFDQKKLSVIIDTREQKPLKMNADVIISALNFGDYATTSHYKGVYIERKSLSDLCGTLSKGYERFQKELSRAKEMGSYIVVCVEEPVTSIMNLESNKEHAKHSRASSDFICHRVRELCQSFDNVQFLFVKNRIHLSETIENLFKLKNDILTGFNAGNINNNILVGSTPTSFNFT